MEKYIKNHAFTRGGVMHRFQHDLVIEAYVKFYGMEGYSVLDHGEVIMWKDLDPGIQIGWIF